MKRIKTLITLLLCISMVFSSMSVSFANPLEEFTGEETVITSENMEEQEEIKDKDNKEDIEEDEDISNEETNTDGEEVIEDDGDSEDTNKEENDIKEEDGDENKLEDIINEEKSASVQGTMGTFGVEDTVTYYVKYVYVKEGGLGQDEHTVLRTDTYENLVVGEEHTFYPADIEGYVAFNIYPRTVTILDTSETIEFLPYHRSGINITFIFKDSEGNIIHEPVERYEKDTGRKYSVLPDIEGYKTPEDFYIDIDYTMIHDFEYEIVYEDVEDEPETDKMTITIHYQDIDGNTIKESDVYEEDKTAPNEYLAHEIEGYIKPDNDKFKRGAVIAGTTHIEHTFVYTKELDYDPNEIIYMPDEGLRAILGFTVDGDITRGQMSERKAINFQSYMYGIPIYDYTGLEYAVNVEKISVSSSVLFDSSNFFEIIQDLENVTEFGSDHCMSEDDLNNLSMIKSLEKISFKFADLGDSIDYSILESLPNLKILDLSNNNITDISSLVGITQLEELDLMRNSLRSIEGLGNLTNLKKLNVAFNNIDFNREPNKTIKEYFMTSGTIEEFIDNTQSIYKLAIITLNHIVSGTGEVIKEPTILNVYEDEIYGQGGHDLRLYIESIGGITDIEGYKVKNYPPNPNILWYGQSFSLNITYEEELAEKAGTVIIHYKDTDGNTIKDSDTYTDVKGYYNGYYSDYVEGYVAIYPYYVSIDITEDGAVYEHTFYFSKNEVAIPTGTIEIRYQDESGNTLRDTDVYQGVTGTQVYNAPNIEGYKLLEGLPSSVELTVLVDGSVQGYTFVYTADNSEPVEPEKPTEPEKPVEPEKPTEPEKPVEPTEPTEPEKPVKPKEETKEEIEEPKVEEPTPEIPKEEPKIEEPKIEEPKEEIKEPEKQVEDTKEVEKPAEPKVEEHKAVVPEIEEPTIEEMEELEIEELEIEEPEIEEPEIEEPEVKEPEIKEPAKPERKRLPIIPIAVAGAAGGLIVLFFYFKKKKNLKIYAVENDKLERLVGKKNIKVHSDEIIIDLKRELEMLIDEDILRLHFNRSLAVRLQDKKIIIMNGHDKVYEFTIEEYVTTVDIEK